MFMVYSSESDVFIEMFNNVTLVETSLEWIDNSFN